MKEINSVCYECGTTANALTCLKRYGNVSKKLHYGISTMSNGVCDYCGKKGGVTSVRDYFFPDFELIQKFLNVFSKKKP